MLQDQGHPLWAELEEEVAHRLEQSADACIPVVKLIEKKLKDFEAKSKSPREILSKGNQTVKFQVPEGLEQPTHNETEEGFLAVPAS
ncbi:hypothetical protein N7G274_000687 [Stereocaulon virgatum]|uniref:Uncharacterized protein n=1 Tax=Stereocaulon virgatum TaxID=373712 RepID=A0ABR4APK8_9LECA